MVTSSSSRVLVGRQAIYDRQLNVFAYELLFRSSEENRAAFEDGDRATSQVLVNSLIEIGLNNLVCGRLAFVNFTRNYLLGNYEIPFEPEHIVIEVLEDIPPDAQVTEALAGLRARGFRIALDDYVNADQREELIELADFIKVDLRAYDETALIAQMLHLQQYPVQLLAEKVETVEEFERCKQLGFHLFQGYFLSRPQVVEGKSLSNNQLAILQLMTKLQKADVCLDEIIEIVKQDVSLSVKLLRYVNSAVHGVRHRIETVRHAVIWLGIHKVCQIVTLIAIAGIDKKPRPLIEYALIRARMCELLASHLSPTNSEVFFTAGLFSSLDALLDRPLDELVEELSLSTELKGALLDRTGRIGDVLNSVMAFEQGDWDALNNTGLDDATIQRAYLDAVDWAQVIVDPSLQGG
ncbi:MAG: HDOD domain-containing protein [Planctomycetota bacterium]